MISAGVCGGARSSLWARAISSCPTSVLGAGGERLNVTPSRHRPRRRAGASARHGTLVTSREVVATPEAKAALFARTGAVAVDMESSLILAAAAAAGCPTLVVRGVSDAAGETPCRPS